MNKKGNSKGNNKITVAVIGGVFSIAVAGITGVFSVPLR